VREPLPRSLSRLRGRVREGAAFDGDGFLRIAPECSPARGIDEAFNKFLTNWMGWYRRFRGWGRSNQTLAPECTHSRTPGGPIAGRSTPDEVGT